MRTFIKNELRMMARPLYFIPYIFLMLITWQLCLPPFQQKLIFDSHQILNFYLFIISTIGMFGFIVLQMSSFAQNKSRSNILMVAVRISGRTYFWGKYISFYLIFFLAFLLPSMFLAMIQQFIFAPDRIDVSTYLYGLVGFIFSFFHLFIYLALYSIVFIKNEFLSLVLFLCSYLILILISKISGIHIFNSQLLFYELTDTTIIYIILWSLCVLFMVTHGNRQSRTILYENDISVLEPNILSRFAARIHAHISSHHSMMMGFVIQKIISTVMIMVLVLIVVVNRSLNYQISQLADLFLMIVVPFVFALNQSFIFKIDRDAGLRESIVLKANSYFKIILNRWFVLVLIQILVQLAGIFVVHFYSHSLPAIYIIYILLLGILISLFNLFVNVTTGSIGLANILLFLILYIQINEDIVSVFQKYTFLSRLRLIYPEAALIDMHICLGVFIFIIVLLIITSTIVQLTKYANLRYVS